MWWIIGGMFCVLAFSALIIMYFVLLNKSNRKMFNIMDCDLKVSSERVIDLESRRSVLENKVSEQELVMNELTTKLNIVSEEKNKILSQKKSSEVRLGKDAEILAPFLEEFKWNPKDSRFLGDPIDFVIFEDESINFVEVKSGNSRLTPKQRKIRDLIKEGKVLFHILRVKNEDKNGRSNG